MSQDILEHGDPAQQETQTDPHDIFAPDYPDLLQRHFEQLTEGSGIAREVITERGYRSIEGVSGYTELKALGFSKQQAHCSVGLLIPLHTTDGKQPLTLYRPDHPQADANGRLRKYLLPKGASVRLDCPPRCRPLLPDPSIRLWVTEGQKKADALASRGAVAICLLGVWNFKGRNALGGTTVLADFDYIALNDREVCLVFDSDVATVPGVRKALERLTEHLRRKGAAVRQVYFAPIAGKKVGVDDYLAAGHTLQDLENLIEAPRPQPQPAPIHIKLLREAPKTLSRLLAWIDGHSYATTWLPLQITTTEYLNRHGEVERLPEAQTTHAYRLFVMRDDGVLFGETFDPLVRPLGELGVDLSPMDQPPAKLLWNSDGIQAYMHGTRPEPAKVFERLVAVYDHFLDFGRSLDEQGRMCRLSACLSLMTWFADAFTVLPYPWPNSPAPGSGKTKWGHCWVGTSYLGYLTSASGSFAALRDLADMGATIVFDDAEILADAQKADPDKVALILAGNRKGVSIPVKEQGVDKRWHTRWLNAYCPRGFTSLRLPFPALQSRAIVIPLVASADPTRANRDPEVQEDWPEDPTQLRADLWALALSLQHEASDMWRSMSREQMMVGRDWERWRAIMSMARLFEQHGVADLALDMSKIITSYNEQKDDFQGTTRISLVIQALMRRVQLPDLDKWTCLDKLDMSTETVRVDSSQICEIVKTLIREHNDEEEEGNDINTDQTATQPQKWPNPKAIGVLLSRLRLKKDRDSTLARTRYRLISQLEVFHLAIAHNILQVSNIMSNLSKHVHLSNNGANGEHAHHVGQVANNMSDMSEHVHMSDNAANGGRIPACALCGGTERWDDHGIQRCVQCWPPGQVVP